MPATRSSRSTARLLRAALTLPVTAAVTAALLGTPGSAEAQSFTRMGWKTDFSKHSVPLNEIVSGGPPKDGIPALYNPSFVILDEADRWLDDREPVAVIRQDGVTKIYPLQILIFHEIANDYVGQTPVSVTYCPLCNTTIAFDRRHDGRLLDFGVTGNLRQSDMVMYDRQTESWWQQATGEGIVGELTGDRLTQIPAPVLPWGRVVEEYPDAFVLSRETGHNRPYGTNPYDGYDRARGPMGGFFTGRVDGRLPAMERVVSLGDPDDPTAVPFSVLREEGLMQLEVDGGEVVVFWAPGTASAVDAREMRESRDVGSGVAYRPAVQGRRLTFESVGEGRYRDRETGTLWSITGEALEGELAGERLPEVEHGNHFWFAWAAFRPETRLVGVDP